MMGGRSDSVALEMLQLCYLEVYCLLPHTMNSLKVLLVGRTGLKSVQVRVGTGMKIVDGTLQRSKSSTASISSSSRRGSASASRAGEAPEVGGLMTTSPEFDRARPALFRAAWASMVDASEFRVDESGDVAPAFVQVWLVGRSSLEIISCNVWRFYLKR